MSRTEVLTLVHTGGVAALITVYYGAVASRVNGAAASLLLRAPVRRRLPRLQAEALLRTGVGGMSQVLALVVLTWVAGLRPNDLIPHRIEASLFAYGALLGLGELGLSTFLVGSSMRLAVLLSPSSGNRHDWVVMSRGGWMRAFLTSVRAAPAPLALVLVVVYIVVEETVFRGVVIGAARPLGGTFAVVISAALFMMAQSFNMPSWRNAVAATVAALVIGIVHGILFVILPNLLPLIVAHLVLFGGALVTPDRER